MWNPDLECPYDPGFKGKDQIVPIPGPIDDRFTEEELHHIRMLYAEKGHLGGQVGGANCWTG